MKTCFVHFTNFGMSMQPSCADQEGFLEYREGYEDNICEEDWTESEILIAEMNKYIIEFQNS